MLSVAELCAVTGEHRVTVQKRFKPGGEWYRDGYKINGKYRLPVRAYNRWLETKRIPLRKEEKKHE
jgi:hypothetical protein